MFYWFLWPIPWTVFIFFVTVHAVLLHNVFSSSILCVPTLFEWLVCLTMSIFILYFCSLSGSTLCFQFSILLVLHWFVWLTPLIEVVDYFVLSMLCCSMGSFFFQVTPRAVNVHRFVCTAYHAVLLHDVVYLFHSICQSSTKLYVCPFSYRVAPPVALFFPLYTSPRVVNIQ